MKETTTSYAYKLKYLNNPTFDKVRNFAKKFIDDLPKEHVDELYSQLERGVVQLNSESQMLVYLYSFGKMHQAKLNYAFEHIPMALLYQPEIDIIDYGCGQAIGTMCYIDFLKQNCLAQKVRQVTLIEPSAICLQRAEMHVAKFCPNANIITVNKTFDTLNNWNNNKVHIDNEPTLHILSNVLDLNFNLYHLMNFVKNIIDAYVDCCLTLRGYSPSNYNQFICVEPYFNNIFKDSRIDEFVEFYSNRNDQCNTILDKYQLNSEKPWTAHIRCFSVGELEENLSTKVTNEDIKNGIEDEFGVVYSKDGKRLLTCKNRNLNDYSVKDGTKIICNSAFQLLQDNSICTNISLQQITLPNTIEAIGCCALWYECLSTDFPSSVERVIESPLQHIIISYKYLEKFKKIIPEKLWNIIDFNFVIDEDSISKYSLR